MNSAEVLDSLSSGLDGPSTAEASPNELSFAGATPWWRLPLRQFISPLIAILLAAAVVTLVQQHWVDSGAIFLILCINAALGFVQERKAEADVRALQSLSTPSCRALRNGSEQVVPGRDLVPGDVVLTGAWMALAVILSFIVELHHGYPETHTRTLALTMFVMLSFFQVFSSRAETKSFFQLRLLANKPLLYTSLAALALHWGVMSWPVTAGLLELTPLNPQEWLLCAAVGSTVVIIVEVEKAVRRWAHRHDGRAT